MVEAQRLVLAARTAIRSRRSCRRRPPSRPRPPSRLVDVDVRLVDHVRDEHVPAAGDPGEVGLVGVDGVAHAHRLEDRHEAGPRVDAELRQGQVHVVGERRTVHVAVVLGDASSRSASARARSPAWIASSLAADSPALEPAEVVGEDQRHRERANRSPRRTAAPWPSSPLPCASAMSCPPAMRIVGTLVDVPIGRRERRG